MYVRIPFKVIASAIPSNNKKQGNGTTSKILLGLLVSLPLILIVINLLISADTIFESYMARIPDIFKGIMVGEYIGRAIFIIIVFFASFSYIFSLIEKRKPPKYIEGDGTVKLSKIFDLVIVVTVMVLMNVIYLLFTAIQFAYLFGGTSIAFSESFTYSEYARRGFFELVAVTVINFGIMLLSIGFTKTGRGAGGVLLRTLYSLLVGNTVVMLVSAYYRMLLYEDAYGFTYLRVFTQAFMIFMLVLFAISLIRIWKDGFSLAKPYIITAITAFVIINYINVDCIIARNNIDRYNKTQQIDIDYLSRLSYDALPVIAEFKPTGDDKVAADIASLIRNKRDKALRYNNWQSFNVSRYKAGKVTVP